MRRRLVILTDLLKHGQQANYFRSNWVTDQSGVSDNRQLSYHRETARQLRKRRSVIRGRWSCLTLQSTYVLRDHLSLCHWKAAKSFHIIFHTYYKRPLISWYLRNDAALSEVTNFSCSTPVRRPSTVNSSEKIVQTSCSETTVHWPHFGDW